MEPTSTSPARMAALSATGSRKAQAGFEPLVSGFVRAPFGDAAAVADIAGRSRDVAAVLDAVLEGEAPGRSSEAASQPAFGCYIRDLK